MTLIYAFIAATQIVVLAVEGPASVSKPGLILLVMAAVASAYSGYMWRRAARG